MRSPAAPLRVAYEAALRASTDLAIAMGGRARIYADVPEAAPLPYVVVGNDQILLDTSSDCGAEAEVVVTVALWSRTAPLDKGVQARAMGDAILDALLVELAVAGWAVDLFEVTSETYSTDPDQSTKGVLVFRYLLTERTA